MTEHGHTEIQDDTTPCHTNPKLISPLMATSDPTVPPTRLDTQPHIFMQLYSEEDAKVLRPSKSVGAQSGGNVRTNPRPTPAHRLGGQQTAEVVLLYSSLAALHRASFASRRALHLLLCKQVDFYVIDANMDVGPDVLPDRQFILGWQRRGLLRLGKGPDSLGPEVPQVFIDGVLIGDDQALQDLEDDNVLNDVLRGVTCPRCFSSARRPACRTAVVSGSSPSSSSASLPDEGGPPPGPSAVLPERQNAEAQSRGHPKKLMKNCCARRAGERCRDCGTSFIRMISPEMLQGPPGKDTMFDQEEEETGLTLSDDDVDSVVYGVLPLVDRGMQRWPDFQHGDTRDALCTAEGIEHSALLSSPLALSSLGGATDGRGTGSNTPGHKSFRSSFSSAETSPKSCRSPPSSLSPCSLSFLEVPHENGSWRTGEDDEVLEFPGDFGEDRRSIPIRHVKPPHCGKNTEHLPAAEVPRCLAPPHVLRAFARVWIKTDQRDNKQVQIDEEWSRREGEKNKDTCSTDGSSLQYGKNTPRTAGTRQNQVSGTIGKPDWLTQQALEGEPFNPLLNRNVEHLHSCSEGNHLKDTPGGGETEDDAGCTTIPDDEEEGIDVLPPIASDILKQPSYSPFSFFPSSLSSVSSFRHSSMEPITSRRSVSLATSASGEYGPVSKPTDSYLYEKTTSTAFPSPPGCLLSSTPSFVSYSSPLTVPSSSSCSPVTPTPLARVGKSFSREETFPQLGKAA